MCGPDGDIWTLCWKFAGLNPSSSSMTLGCGGEYLESVLVAFYLVYRRLYDLLDVVEGLPCSSYHWPSWWISCTVTLSGITGICQCLKMALYVLGSAGNRLILTLRWWHFLHNICMRVERYAGKTQHNMSLFFLLSWWHRRGGRDNGSSRDHDTNPFLHGMPTCV